MGISRSGPSEGLQKMRKIGEVTHGELGTKVTGIIEPALKYTNNGQKGEGPTQQTTYIIS